MEEPLIKYSSVRWVWGIFRENPKMKNRFAIFSMPIAVIYVLFTTP